MTAYVTLEKYFQEALVESIPDWFSEVVVGINDAYGNPSKPRWHQVTGLNYCFNQTRTGIWDEQGTGKTLIAQAFAIWNVAVGNTVYCLMPPVLIGQFYESLLETFKGVESRINVVKYKGTVAERSKIREKINSCSPCIILMSYKVFDIDKELLPKVHCLIADECKIIGNPESKTCKSITAALGKFGDCYALIMNGTPANNMLDDLFGYMKFLTPWVYHSKLSFDNKHVKYKKLPVRLKGGKLRQVRQVDGFENIDEMFKNFFIASRRVEKHQVVELPPKNIIPVSVELSPAHQFRYERFFEERLLEFADGTVLDGSASSSLRQLAMQCIADPSILGLTEESEVLNLAKQMTDDIVYQGKKVFVLVYYRKTVEKLAKLLAKHNPALIYGGSSNNEAQKNKFLKDPECMVCIANYQSGGVGLNLQGVCSEAICVEPTTVPGVFDQACDRLHRTGQKESVNIYILKAKGTLYVKAISDMLKKRDLNAKVVRPVDFISELFGRTQEDSESGTGEVVEMRSHDTAGLAMAPREC
jgi:SNF2 family DNA or RNA helicase